MAFCSPKRENKSKYSCFDGSALIKIAEEYNRIYDDKITIPAEINDKTHLDLWKQIKIRLQRIAPCPHEFCWIDVDFVKGLKLDDNFRPSMPEEWTKDMNTWLNNFDIENVLNQYEQLSADFEFIGPVPIDFDSKTGAFSRCVSDALCNLNIKSLWKSGKRKLGVVFNLDPHYKGGSHWVAMYADLASGAIYFYDSYGMAPPKEVVVLMNRIKEQGDAMIGIDIKKVSAPLPEHKNYKRISNDGGFQIYYNRRRFQYENSECGPFSMNFIVDLLLGKSYPQVLASPIDDKKAMNTRLKFYTPPIEFIKGGRE